MRTKVLEEKIAGPKVAIICGSHGNEDIGVIAGENVFRKLQDKKYIGEICVHRGNLSALQQGVRFIDRDFNRLWTDDRISNIDQLKDSAIVEERELYESYTSLRDFYDGLHVPAFMFDLHATSSQSTPFSISFDNQLSLDLTAKLAIPTICWPNAGSFWYEVLTSYASRRGVASTVFEVGPLSDKNNSELLEACVWDGLYAIEVIGEDCLQEVDKARELLKSQSENIPRRLEIFHEHLITLEDKFVMRPGYRNFQEVSKGEHLADDVSGPIYAIRDSILLFPLYQGVSDYGFALALASE